MSFWFLSISYIITKYESATLYGVSEFGLCYSIII